MSKPEVTIEGRRIYIKAIYGHPCVSGLKSLGAHWEPETKRWWISSAKKSQVEKIIQESEGKENTAVKEDREVMVVGKAKYKGRSYYVRWIGRTKKGEYKARLCTLDEKLDFWVDAAEPHMLHIKGDGNIAFLEKTYEEPRSLAGIRSYVESLKKAEYSGVGSKPDEECYLRGGEWLVRGCSQCSSLGTMCKSCRFDIYDN